MEETRLVLLGPPACGKGTQGRRLAKEYGLGYFSTGKQLRREVEAGTALGQEADKYLSRTEYVPDQLVLAIVSDWVSKQGGGWILDGFPRTVMQAEELDRFPSESIRSLRALLIDVDREVLAQRVSQRCECGYCSWTGTSDDVKETASCPSCGGALIRRRDDEPEAFRKRMDIYEELTLPVIEHYSSSGGLLRISGIGTQGEVSKRVKDALQSHG
ncbi:MAG: nucleoside monophosphate kinase [Akkermansiaceae bacterium]|mgnify:CR=1 FL=1|nr:nucleoside monophosphate kinase [Akkermansiaceae bacterium]